MDVNSLIDELTSNAAGLDNMDPAKTTLLEQAVKLADSINDTELGYNLRDDLMSAASGSNRDDIVVVAFSWCLAEYDRNPDKYSQYSLLWKYKWVFANAKNFPGISLEKLNQMQEDIESRYKCYGSSMHAVYSLQRSFYLSIGNIELAKRLHAKFKRTRRDFLSDCPACVAHSNMLYHKELGQWSLAIKGALPVLEKKLTCAKQPHLMYSSVLLPLFMQKKYEDADDFQAKGIKLISRHRHFISSFAHQITYLTMRGNLAKAKTIIEKYFPLQNASGTLDEKLDFYLAVKLFCDRKLKSGTSHLKLRLPEYIIGKEDQSKTDLAQLSQIMEQKSKEIALQFDKRNKTTNYMNKLAKNNELLDIANKAFPL